MRKRFNVEGHRDPQTGLWHDYTPEEIKEAKRIVDAMNDGYSDFAAEYARNLLPLVVGLMFDATVKHKKANPPNATKSGCGGYVYALHYDTLQEIHTLTSMTCGWPMSLPIKMINQAQKVHGLMIALQRIKPPDAAASRQRAGRANAAVSHAGLTAHK